MSGACWVCGCEELVLVRRSTMPAKSIDAEAVRITDSSYGMTADLFRCVRCGFLQCSNFTSVLSLYENMADERYEETRRERAVQALGILLRLPPEKAGGRLLDVGAGSGILVEEALAMGFKAVGIEPSRWLQTTAMKYGLPISLGVLPHRDISGPFDVITLIDVIEHVPNPIAVLTQCAAVLADSGYGILVTPDVGSIAARVLGSRWWHFRPAHIGYFNCATLSRLLDAANLQPVRFERAGWVFPADYIWERINAYLPAALRFRAPESLKKISVPVNLLDSWFVLFKKKV